MVLSYTKIGHFIGHVLVGLMLVFPTKLQVVKLLLLAIIFIFSIFKLSGKGIPMKLLFWGYLYMLCGLISICYGMILNNPAPHKYILVYIFWPILFTYFSFLIDKEYFYSLLKVIKYYLSAILIIGIFACVIFNLSLMQIDEFLGYESAIRPGYPIVGIMGPAVTTMIFWYFFYFTKFLLSNDVHLIDRVNLILGIIFIFMTSRRILFLNFFFVFVLTMLLLPFVKNKQQRNDMKGMLKKRMVRIFFLVIVLIYVAYKFELFDFSAIGNFLSETGEVSDTPRLLQSEALIEGWMENPFLGNGAGINASVARSETPGTYELTYLAMLFERGIVGILVFVLMYIVLMVWSIRCLNKNAINTMDTFALIIALNLFMIANATNPYLNAFDYIWFLFILFVNIRISNENKEKDMCTDKSIRQDRGFTV